MNFGSNLARLRKMRHLSQEELAEKLGVSRQTIYTWESEISSPNIENLRALSTYFGCSVDDLVNGVPPEGEQAEQTEEERLVCLGDKESITQRVHRFALSIAGGVFLVLLGVAFLIWGGGAARYELLGFAGFFVLLAAAVFLFIFSSINYDAFMQRPENKHFHVLYSKEEKSAEWRRYALILAGSVALLLLDVLFVVLYHVGAEADTGTWATAVFMLVIGIATFFIVNFSIRLAKYGEPEPTPEGAEQRLQEMLHSVLWLVTVGVYLFFGLAKNLWHPTWVVFPLAGLLSGIITTVCEYQNKTQK
ncbi:MAG: helix-turn-helix transcriptional regulator [Eubacteriales bacterium]